MIVDVVVRDLLLISLHMVAAVFVLFFFSILSIYSVSVYILESPLVIMKLLLSGWLM